VCHERVEDRLELRPSVLDFMSGEWGFDGHRPALRDVPPQTAEALDGGVHAISRRREPLVCGNQHVEQ